mmetsp:Transcript_9833/g.24210  ORF Transcript_9833/g.24210 Transcript_9833/m.24210 type:complete len:296 (+) Transcript_9833:97-984(+)
MHTLRRKVARTPFLPGVIPRSRRIPVRLSPSALPLPLSTTAAAPTGLLSPPAWGISGSSDSTKARAMATTASLPVTAAISCTCGKVKVSFLFSPVQRKECCCCDCRKGLSWCTEQGGEQPPPVPDLVYFPNAIKVEAGFEHLRCFLLQKNYNTHRVVASCCWTPLIGDHPAYGGLRVVSYNRPGKLSMNQGQLRPVDARIFQDDMTKDELQSLPPFVAPTNPTETSDAMKEAKSQLHKLYSEHKSLSSLGVESIQALVNRIGKVEIADPNYKNVPEPFWNKKIKETARRASTTKK